MNTSTVFKLKNAELDSARISKAVFDRGNSCADKLVLTVFDAGDGAVDVSAGDPVEFWPEASENSSVLFQNLRELFQRHRKMSRSWRKALGASWSALCTSSCGIRLRHCQGKWFCRPL